MATGTLLLLSDDTMLHVPLGHSWAICNAREVETCGLALLQRLQQLYGVNKGAKASKKAK
jgi:hypothetical protein